MVRRFLTISEIECTAQFVPGNPVAKESYRRLVGWYDFDVEELKCCVATASGGLCAHIHRKGWVVELTNSTLSIIGHICAGDKFGVDSQVVQDIGRAQNAIDEARLRADIAVRELRAALSTHDNVVERLRQLVINCDAILASDLLPFCFLTPSWPDRVIPAKMMLDRMGKPNERPQAWLQRFEEELKSEYGVRTISVR